MKRFFAIIYFILYLADYVIAAPFISINSVDGLSEFPKVKVVVTVSEEMAAYRSLDERNFQLTKTVTW